MDLQVEVVECKLDNETEFFDQSDKFLCHLQLFHESPVMKLILSLIVLRVYYKAYIDDQYNLCKKFACLSVFFWNSVAILGKMGIRSPTAGPIMSRHFIVILLLNKHLYAWRTYLHKTVSNKSSGLDSGEQRNYCATGIKSGRVGPTYQTNTDYGHSSSFFFRERLPLKYFCMREYHAGL